jgi:hypothetical protein
VDAVAAADHVWRHRAAAPGVGYEDVVAHGEVRAWA